MFKKIKKYIKSNPLYWYNIRNFGNHLRIPQLDHKLNLIVDEIRENGISKSDFSTVFPEIDWDRFIEQVYFQVDSYENLNETYEHEDKKYMNFILGINPLYESSSLWAKIAEHNSLKLIAQSYFKMKNVEMRYYNIWKHESSEDEAKGSQLWHRDREDLKILKIFICIEDIDFNKGPFVYAKGTHIEGNVTGNPVYFKEKSGTKRTTDEMMEQLVPKSEWIYSTGKKGTIVFADTHGYHKGGYVKEGHRLLFTCMYVSPACERFYFKYN